MTFSLPPSPRTMQYPQRQAAFLPPLPAQALAQPIAAQLPTFSPASSSPPNPTLIPDMISAYQNKQQTQQGQGSFIQNILSQRFQTNQNDEVTAYNRNTAALAAPNVFKSTTPEDVAMDRAKLELAPYTTAASMKTNTPAAVQEYEYYNSLPADQREAYLNVKRNQNYQDFGGFRMNPSTGDRIDKTLPPQDQPTNKFNAARATTAGTNMAEGQNNLPKMQDTINTMVQSVGNVNAAIDNAKKLSGFFTTGYAGNSLKDVAGTPAHDLQQTLSTIRSNIGFDKLQEMRNNSPTGGALGSVSDQENKLLASAVASLEQSQTQQQFESNLERVKSQYQNSIMRLRNAYERDAARFGADLMPQFFTSGGGQQDGYVPLPANPNTAMGAQIPTGAASHRYNPATGQLEANQ